MQYSKAKRLIRNSLFAFSLGFMAVLPVAGYAIEEPPPTFTDPLGGTSIDEFIRRIILWLVGIVGLLAMLALVWGGIMYVVSFGNEPRLQLAKRIVIWAIVGLVIVMLAYVIVAAVGELIGVTAPASGS